MAEISLTIARTCKVEDGEPSNMCNQLTVLPMQCREPFIMMLKETLRKILMLLIVY